MLIAVVVDLNVALLVKFEGHALRQRLGCFHRCQPKAFALNVSPRLDDNCCRRDRR
jgi:hypothetical protein